MEVYDKFLDQMENYTLKNPKYNLSRDQYTNPVLPLLYDAVHLYGLGLNSCLSNPPCNWTSGKDMLEQFRFKQFQGKFAYECTVYLVFFLLRCVII